LRTHDKIGTTGKRFHLENPACRKPQRAAGRPCQLLSTTRWDWPS